MPTLKYKVQTRCWNCGEVQHTEMMNNHALIPADPIENTASHYVGALPKAEQTLISTTKIVFKRCNNCREPDLIPLHLWDATVRRVYDKG